MTACANNNEGKAFSGKKAVSATLAGVLAVGMVPAAALATEAPADGADEAGIDLLALNDVQNWNGGSITAATNALGQTVSDLGSVEFVDNGDAQYVVPTEVTLADGTVVKLADLKEGYTIQFYKDAAVNSVTGAVTATETVGKITVDKEGEQTIGGGIKNIDDPNTYAVSVLPEGDGYKGAESQKLAFEIVKADYSDATVYQVNNAPGEEKNFSDTTYTWNNKTWGFNGADNELGVVLDGVKQTVTSATFYNKSNVAVGATVTDPGTYKAVIELSTGDKIEREVTIDKFDLSKAKIAFESDPVLNSSTQTGSIIAKMDDETIKLVSNGADNTFKADFKVNSDDLLFKLTPNQLPAADSDSKGSYTWTLAPVNATATDEDKTANFVAGEGTIEYLQVSHNVNDADASDHFAITYNGAAMASSYTINRDKGAADFDLSKIAVAAKIDGKEYPLSFGVTVMDEDRNVVETPDFTKTGTYTVKVTVDAAATGYEYGGTFESEVKVSNGEIATTDVVIKHGEDLIYGQNNPIEYTGEDVLDDIAVTVKVDGKTLTEGTDYTVKYLKGTTGTTEATEAVDAGDYRIVVEGANYKMTAETVNFQITAATLNGLRVSNVVKYGDTKFMQYTGEALTPEFEYNTEEDQTKVTESDWKALPTVYKVEAQYAKEVVTEDTEWEDVDEIKAKGYYKLTISANPDAEGYKNFNYAGSSVTTCIVKVSDAKVFADVSNDHWAAGYIYKAASDPLSYMTGYAGSDFFGPENAITRGDVCVVLARMAGIELASDAAGWTEGDRTFDTPFNDVNEGKYYAQAIAWAAGYGVVTGDTDAAGNAIGTFRPDDTVTREEFATMLARYAQKAGNFEAAADVDAELDKYADGGQISGWAADAIAWLSSEGIMTGDKGAMAGYMLPGNNVTRAEVAKMVVEYQPERSTIL